MTRVLHVLDHSLPLHSGYTFRSLAIMKAQKALGIDVRGLTGLRQEAWGGGTAPIEEAGIRFERTLGRPEGSPGVREWREIAALSARITELARDWRPDVIHAHSPSLCGMGGLRAARKLDVPLVYEIRAFWEDAAAGNGTGHAGSLRYWLTRQLENRVIAGADAVVTICGGLRDDLIARGFAGKDITVMPNGVDLTMFGDPPPPDPALAAELGLGAHGSWGPVIGFIGSFYPYEGLDDLIAAMPAILAAQPHARLLLVGGGPDEALLKAQAQASPAAHAIRFIGRVPHHEVERYYALTDVLCYPRKAMRLTELVTPLKPLEAMAQGKLVAASSVGGHRELIADGVTGTLFAPDDPAALAAALAGLFAAPEAWPHRRETARQYVGRDHDWATNAARYLPVYQRLIDPVSHTADLAA
jgi:PEP-CTERM/exosortase A-associated glycosyltransferase